MEAAPLDVDAWQTDANRLRWLAAMPKATGAISLVASSLIILSICRDRRKLRKTYHRLVLGMSVADWVSSFAIFLSTWMIPRDHDAFYFPGSETEVTIPWAFGTYGTCQLQAGLMQFTQSGVMYGVSMGLFFMLIIQFRWRDAKIQRLEPLLHAIPVLWGICAAVGGHLAGVFGVAYPFCWLEHSTARALISRWVMVFVPAWLNMTILSCCCLSIYFHVRKIDRKSRRFRFSRAVDNGEEFRGAAEKTNEAEVVSTSAENNSMETEPDVESAREDSTTSNGVLSRRSSLVASFTFLSSKVRQQRRLEKYRRTREVASQCFLFAGAFFVVWVPTTIVLVIGRLRGEAPFSLRLASLFTMPLQGLPNFLVYVTPKYRALLLERPELSTFRRLRLVLFPERDFLDEDEHSPIR